MNDRTSKTAKARLLFGLGSLHRIPSPRRRQRLIQLAQEIGFTSFDVAPAYGNGLNELELGIAMSGHRTKVEITTKFGIPVDLYGERYRLLFPVLRAMRKYLIPGYARAYERRDLTGQAMIQSLEGSLRRLRTDYIDRLLIHEPREECTAPVMEDLSYHAELLKRDGKIREFGVAGVGDAVPSFARHACIDVVQTSLSQFLGSSRERSKFMVAYGVYRYFLEHTPRGAQLFSDFVRALLKERADLGLILTSTSARTVNGFRALFA